MSAPPVDVIASTVSLPVDASSSSVRRLAYADIFRGLLIAHMALDHASLFNAGRGAEELAAAAPEVGTLGQFLLRFSGVPVAPAFFFMAGFMVAVSSLARAGRGIAESEITRRLVIRGLVLILVDACIMGLPRALMGFYSFMVLSCIGVAIVILAWARHLPTKVLLPVSLGILALHPLLDVSGLPIWLQAFVYEPVRSGAIRSLYPLIPWIGLVLLGFVVGRAAREYRDAEPAWLAWGAVSLALFILIRFTDSYGNAYHYEHVLSLEFWHFAKYPPDLGFLSWSLAVIFFSLATLKMLTAEHSPAPLRPFAVLGRVPFFFYVVHFYVLGITAAIIRAKFGLPETFLIWLALLAVMLGACHWYYLKKTYRPNLITRYL